MNINYSKQFLDYQDINEVVKSLKNQYLTQGPKINEFEKKIAKYVGSKYAVAVSSCTAGLHIALKAINFKKKDTLLTSRNAFLFVTLFSKKKSNLVFSPNFFSGLIILKSFNSLIEPLLIASWTILFVTCVFIQIFILST